MSRSYKKNPVVPIASAGNNEKAMKKAKCKANRKVRKFNDEISMGGQYKKLDERYTWPDDGKRRFEDVRAYRK